MEKWKKMEKTWRLVFPKVTIFYEVVVTIVKVRC